MLNVANRTDGNHENSMPANPVTLDFRIGYDSVVDIDGRSESSSSLSLDSDPNIGVNEDPLNADSFTANEAILVNTSYENEFISIALGENPVMNRY